MKRLIIASLLIAVVLLGAFSCGESESEPTRTYMPTTTPAPEAVGSQSLGMIPMPPMEEGEDSYYESDESNAVSVGRMIIRTGEMYLVVEDVGITMDKIITLAETYDGWVVNSNIWQERDRTVGNISIRVLAEHFDNAIRDLRNMADEVKQESTSGRDVTEEYTDLNSRLTNLEASEAQLLELMQQAGDVSEILEVQRELSKTRSEIEQIKGRMKYLEESSSTSLLQISLEQSKLAVEFYAETRNVKEGEEVRFYADISGGFSPYSYEWDFGDGNTSTEESPSYKYKNDGNFTVKLKVTDDRAGTAEYERTDYITVLPGWDAGNIASSAWNGLVGFGRVLLDIIIWLGIFSPVWIIIGLIIYFTIRRRRGKKQAN